MPKKRVIIDTDAGTDIDDVLAILLAISLEKEVEIVAVTTVGRQSYMRAMIVEKYFASCHKRIPVYVGEDIPVYPSTRLNWFGNEGKQVLPGNHISAVDYIINLYSAKSDVEIIALGPMMNLAVAIQKNPKIAENIPFLTVMGGVINHPKYKDKVFPFRVDYNLSSDARASLIVLTSSIKNIRLVTADVTLQVWLDQKDEEQLKAIHHPTAQLLVKDMQEWTAVQRRIFGDQSDNVAFLHDPLTLACALDESFCTFEELNIECLLNVIENNEVIFRTIPRPQPLEGVTKVMRCAVAVDSQKFHDFFMNNLKNVFVTQINI